jgi:tetratricopeptide (TPR) repeat protein
MNKPLRLFVSSPGDVAEERLVARRVIQRVQSSVGDRLKLEPVFWEHEPLAATGSFQGQLPRPSESDIVVCILWSRLGTRLPGSFKRADGSSYASGTEFEFEDAVAGFRRNGRPELLVYRKTAPVVLASAADPTALQTIEQRRALDTFIHRWFHDESDGHLRAAFHPFQTAADFEDIFEAHLLKLIARHRPETTESESSVTWRQGSPFRGLQTFGAEHTDIFFGRTRAVSDCIDALRRQHAAGRPFLLIMGMSGCGKSSLVYAGLVPMLQQPGVIQGIGGLAPVTVRPAEGAGDPVGQLAAALASLSSDGSETTRRPLVILDQFEELFSDDRITENDRLRFFAKVSELCRESGVWFIATMRSDLYPVCGRYPDFVALKEGAGQYDLLPPQPSELGQMIRLPAAAAGLSFDIDPATGQSLDEQLRDEAIGSPESLPLLEFALDELYQRRSENGTLTLHAYRAIGGVAGALARRAEQVFQSLPAAVQGALPPTLQAAVTIGAEGAGAVNRRAALFEGLDDNGKALAEAFVAARLFVSNVDAEGCRVFSVAHEALLRQWPRVTQWLEENRELLRMRTRLSLASIRWIGEQKSPDLLLAAGKQVEEGNTLLHSGMALTAAEREFVDRSIRRARRNRRIRLAAVASLAVLSIAAATAALVANQQRLRAELESSTTRQTIDFMVGLFSLADPEENRGNQVTVREILDRGAQRIATNLKEQPRVKSSLLTAMGQAYTGLGLYDPANELLSGAVREYQGMAGAGSENALTATLALAKNQYLAGNYDQAIEGYRRAAQQARGKTREPNAALSAALNGLADCLVQKGENQEAEPLYREALAMDQRLHGAVDADVARSLNGLGSVLLFEGRYAEAENNYRKALAIRQRLLGDRDATVAESLGNLASVQYQAGKYVEAAKTYQQALPVYRAVFGPDHPEVATILNNLGRSYLMAAQLKEAKPLFDHALSIDRAHKPAGHDDFITPLNSLGMIAMSDGDFETAERELTEALAIARAHDHWMLSQVLVNMADLHARQAHLEKAHAYVVEARNALNLQYPRDKAPEEAWRHAILDSIEAEVMSREGRANEALPRLVQATAILRQRFGAEGLFVRDALAREKAAATRTTAVHTLG